MAHLEERWRCTGCRVTFRTETEARRHVHSHVKKETWAVSDKYPGKEVACNYRGTQWALREADLSDFLPQRKRDLDGGV